MEPTEVTVLSFNICLGGMSVDVAQVAAAIIASGADVVGLQEAGGNARLIARLAGLAHVDERHQVISRWPIADPTGAAGSHVYVQPAPGRVVAIANVHLPADRYGPHLLRDGLAVDAVLAAERETRLSALGELTPAWDHVVATGVPLVVTGDFNTPAHTDWGASWDEHRARDVPWPVSAELATRGFVDTYRAANPTRAGLTWTYGYPHPSGDGREPRDRIDFVWALGHDEVVDATVVGPAGVPDVGIVVDPWPSDHLGVRATLRVRPAEPPPFVAALRHRVEIGQVIRARFAATRPRGDRIALVPAGAAPTEALMWLPPLEVERFGQVGFGTGHLEPGEYDVVLTADGDVVGRSPVAVVARGARPEIAARFEGGELVVEWRNAPGRKFDWIGVWQEGDPDLYHGVVAATHIRASVHGRHAFVGLEAGTFTVRLLTDDSMIVLAEAHVGGR